MNLHLHKDDFINIIERINDKYNIRHDILEKDYYVCCILKQLSQKQNELQAYFKGGTALYKIINSVARFSEDIDLTVKVMSDQSNNRNKTRLEKSSKGYTVEGLTLDKSDERSKNVKNSITSFYKYESNFKNTNQRALYKPSEIQVESTSFTVSEPHEECIIEPFIYTFASQEEKEILSNIFDVKPFKIEVQTLERIFIDKIFACETYYTKNNFQNFSKHLFDITIMYKQSRIKDFLNNKNAIHEILQKQRAEELVRFGGISQDLHLNDFQIFNLKYNQELEEHLQDMQKRYIIMPEFKINLNLALNSLKNIKEKLIIIDD